MNLIYTVAFSPRGWRGNRLMAKLLCSSLLRHLWEGEIVVFRNFEEPLFPVERKQLTEIYVDLPLVGTDKDSLAKCLRHALEMRFHANEFIQGAGRYEWVAYFDADCLALRDIGHLFSGSSDVLVQPEVGRMLKSENVFNGYIDDRGYLSGYGARATCNNWLGHHGINAGSFAVRGVHFNEFLKEWKALYESPPPRHADFRDQTSFNRLLLDTSLKVRPFERGEIMFPFHLNTSFLEYKEAALLHFVGGTQIDKANLSFALHMLKMYGDEGGLFLDLVDS